MSKRIFMIAGPNGAGKTTMAPALLSGLPMLYEFINADEIAKGLAPLHTEGMAVAAGKLMIRRLQELLEAEQSFAFETTASGTNYLKYLKKAKANGYEINMMYLWLASSEQAIRRVAKRVMQKGHDIPSETIRRRYYTGLKNLFRYYLPFADSVIILDNSIAGNPRTIARKNIGGSLKVYDMNIWNTMQKGATYEEVK